MKNQEVEGLLSPWLRDVRMRNGAKFVKEGAVVLDLACGAGFLRRFLPENTKYIGVDRIAPPSKESFDAFLNQDLVDAFDLDQIKKIIPDDGVDVVAMFAFIEHLKEPEVLLKAVRSILKDDGIVIATTPAPIGRKLHDGLAAIGICSSSGAAEHEKFFSKSDIYEIFRGSGYKVDHFSRFLFCLNQLAVAHPKS